MRRRVISAELQRGTLDVVIDTVSAGHDITPYLHVLGIDGTLFSVGHLGPVTVPTFDLLIGRKRLASAGSGGRRYTQELLDFCSEHGVVADIEIVSPPQIADTLTRLPGDVEGSGLASVEREFDDLRLFTPRRGLRRAQGEKGGL